MNSISWFRLCTSVYISIKEKRINTNYFMWSDWRRKNKRKTLRLVCQQSIALLQQWKQRWQGGQCGSLFPFLCCCLACCLQAFLVVLLGKAHVPQELRVYLQQGKVWWENGNSKRMWRTFTILQVLYKCLSSVWNDHSLTIIYYKAKFSIFMINDFNVTDNLIHLTAISKYCTLPHGSKLCSELHKL